MASLPLDEITNQEAVVFATRNGRLSPSTVNQALRTLRRALKLAEWGKLKRATKITLAKGERHPDRVLTDEEVRLYLMACLQPWRDVATIMYCLGSRPSELYSLRWEHVIFNEDRACINIVRGKSAKARRVLPMMPAVFRVLKSRHDQQGNPRDGWVFPSESRSGHLEQGSAKNQHMKAIQAVNNGEGRSEEERRGRIKRETQGLPSICSSPHSPDKSV
jgi:integrase